MVSFPELVLTFRNVLDCAKYFSLPNFDHLESSLTDIKDSLFGLETLLKQSEKNEYMENVKDKELISENKFLKMKVELLEKKTRESCQNGGEIMTRIQSASVLLLS